MKLLLNLCATTFLAVSAMAQSETVSYPAQSPLVTLTIPDGWQSREEKGVLQAASSADLDTMLVVRPLNATKKQGAEAIAEIKSALAGAYGDNIEYDELEEGGTEDLGFYVLNSKTTMHSANEGDVEVFMNSIIISLPDSDELLLAQFLSTAKGAEQNGEAIMSVVKSLAKAQ